MSNGHLSYLARGLLQVIMVYFLAFKVNKAGQYFFALFVKYNIQISLHLEV